MSGLWSRLVLRGMAISMALPGAGFAAATTTTDAAPTAAPAELSTAVPVAAPASAGSLFTQLDIRPSLTASGDNLYTENSVEAGYTFGPATRVTYLFAFDTNLADKTRQGLGLKVWNGFFRVRQNNLLVSDDKTLSLSYQGRLYMPTDAAERDKGFLTQLRTYLTLTKKFSDGLSLSFSEVPILHAYTKAGLGKAANKSVFENMMILSATVKLSKSVSLTVPFIYHLAKFQSFAADAKRSGAWASNLWIWPELEVALNNTHSVGVAYYSGNLVAENLGDTSLDKGLRNGVGQLFWTVTL